MSIRSMLACAVTLLAVAPDAVAPGAVALAAGTPKGAAGQEVTFKAADGVVVYADLYTPVEGKDAPFVLLFHQAGANARAEYGPVIPRLLKHGFDVLAVDQRSGGDRLGGNNRTVDHLGKTDAGYCDAYPDLEAALRYVVDHGYTGPRIVWGSSYSAALVIKLGVEHADEIAAVLAFSPASGSAMGACDPTGDIERIDVPVLALRPGSEMEREASRRQFDALEKRGNATYVAPKGVHGSSMLNPDRAGGVEDTWKAVFGFIDSVIRD